MLLNIYHLHAAEYYVNFIVYIISTLKHIKMAMNIM